MTPVEWLGFPLTFVPTPPPSPTTMVKTSPTETETVGEEAEEKEELLRATGQVALSAPTMTATLGFGYKHGCLCPSDGGQ